MIIDSHAHFEPRMLDLDAMVAKMDDAGVGRVALIPTMNDPLPKTPERLLAVLRKLMQTAPGRLVAEGVHRALWTPEGNIRLDGRVYRVYARPDNGAVARAIEAHPDRFYGWIFLNPRNNPDVLDELERWRHAPGMVGLKLHPHWHDYRTELLRPLLSRAEELGLPALIHLGFRKRGAYRDLCEAFPRLNIIAAHAGFPFYQDLWRYGRHRANLFVDLSSPYIDEPLARGAVRVLGAHRCLYGTDSPYGFHDHDDSYDYGAIKGWVERMPVSSADQARIFGETFLGLVDASSP